MEDLHVFVSPHLDDVVLSCGASIAGLVRSGRPVTVVTVFAGDPVSGLSELARSFERKWRVGGMGGRRREDEVACALLGAACMHLDFEDAIYRRRADGVDRCLERPDLFGSLIPDDCQLAGEVAERLCDALPDLTRSHVYGPVGVGSHIDHHIVRLAVEQAARRTEPVSVALYEDLPYGFVAENWTAPANRSLVDERTVFFGEAGLDAKINAIAAYESQLPSLWAGPDWKWRLRQSSKSPSGIGYRERRWRPQWFEPSQ